MANQSNHVYRVNILAATLVSASFLFCNAPASASGDAVRGKQKFKATCEVCHLAMDNAARNDELIKIGPNLFGVVGRPAGTYKGFRYSQAMKASGITWTEEVLGKYIEAPQKMVPSVRMTFQGVSNPQDIDDIVAYLATLGPTTLTN